MSAPGTGSGCVAAPTTDGPALPAPVRERPILFSAPMIRALLAGTKTQTRRLVKPQPEPCDGHAPNWRNHAPDGWWCANCGNGVWRRDFKGFPCPYGVPGDVLWVRETWGINHSDYFSPIPKVRPAIDDEYFVFLATEDDPEIVHEMPWRPSIHMPRWASRISLRVTDVRVERLQEIDDGDAMAEGIGLARRIGFWFEEGEESWAAARMAYRALWERINGPGSWDANPWVWCVSFSVADTSTGNDRNRDEKDHTQEGRGS